MNTKEFVWDTEIPSCETEKYINSSMLHEFAGYVSRCWDSDGVFEAEKVIIACDNLSSYLAMDLEHQAASFYKEYDIIIKDK